MKSRSALSLNRLTSKPQPISRWSQADHQSRSEVFRYHVIGGTAPEVARTATIRNIFPKKSLFSLDGTRQRTIFVIPPEAGPEAIRGGSRTFWDCKLDSILSRLLRLSLAIAGRRRTRRGDKIEFFVAPTWTGRLVL